VKVFVRDNNVDQALKVLKKKMQREGIFREMRLRLRAGGVSIITRLQFLTSARSKVVLNSNSARSAFPLIDTAATTEDGSKPTSATMSMTIAGLRTYERPTAWLRMQSAANQSPPPNSLPTGKLTGNFAESGNSPRFSSLISARIQ
jgi:hypothetical protein